jgi:hypothetical protein
MNGNGRLEAAINDSAPSRSCTWRMSEESAVAPFGIDDGMALATQDLLARVIATRSASFVGLHALAVDDAGAWRGRQTAAYAIDYLAHAPVPRARHDPAKPTLFLGERSSGKNRQATPTQMISHDDLARREEKGRPIRLGVAIIGAISRHSASVVSVSY